jgi:selenocysteine lyase/cysteine desulfurase
VSEPSNPTPGRGSPSSQIMSALTALGAGHVIVHGYKWLPCPRGAAWMATRADRLDLLDPLMPNWKSTSPPHGYFGGDLEMMAGTAGRLDASPA